MNDQLERLIKLQEIDSKILAINRIIAEFPLKIAEAELPLKESMASLGNVKQKFETLDKRKRDKERALDDIDEKIKKLKTRTIDIKTNKEYQALLKEIESIEKDRSATEEEILTIMIETDTISKQSKSEESKFIGDKEKVEALKKKLDGEKSEVEKDLIAVKEIRSKIADVIEKEIHDEYIELFEILNGIAVTEAKEEICLGCNMNIPPQLFVELKKNEEIMYCPQCRRILYFKNSTY
ncbi:MAG: C4-type zinc ribbon domain-containing protein [Thermodesulfovibrionales bacterium]